jgi:hypothetical protein
MKKLVPILSLTLCALLIFSLARPVTAYTPQDGDTLEYETRVDLTIKLAAGPPDYDYDIEMDHVFEILNHTGDLYWTNITTTLVGPSEIFGSMTGNDTWAGILHHFPTNMIPHMHPMDPFDWDDFAPYWMTSILYIEPGLEPGDSLSMGQSDMLDNTSYYYMGVPVMAGPAFAVAGQSLSTVKIGMHYEYHENVTLNPSPYYPYWDMVVDFEMIWEWSLGFLCQVNFDFYMNTYPYDLWDPTEIFVEGNFTLVDYSLATAPQPYLGGAAAAAAAGMLPIIVAVIAVVIIICFIIFFLIWRSRKGK